MWHWKPTICRQNYWHHTPRAGTVWWNWRTSSVSKFKSFFEVKNFSVCTQWPVCPQRDRYTVLSIDFTKKKNRLADSGKFKPSFRCTSRTVQLKLGLVVTAIRSLSSCMGSCIHCRPMYCIQQAYIITHKAITGEALWVPGCWGSQISRQSAHEGGKVVSPRHWPSLPPKKYSWYSFLLETESTPGPWCDRKDYVNEKFVYHQQESDPRPSGL